MKNALPSIAQLQHRLTNLYIEHGFTLGIELNKNILDVSATAARLGVQAPADLDDLLQNGRIKEIEMVLSRLTKNPEVAVYLNPDTVSYAPLVTRPEKIICIGFNYKKHAEETGTSLPKEPPVFSKYNNALNHHRGTISLPTELDTRFDFETELVIVMGQRCKNVAENDALNYVAGFTIGNDFSARTRQTATSQFGAGKMSDGFAPLGPWLTPAALVNDPNNLTLTTDVNGKKRQDGTTRDMIFNCHQLIAYLSRVMTLSPGDIIFTGTPQGVIFGESTPPEQRRWLRAGDHIVSRIEGLGALSFKLI